VRVQKLVFMVIAPIARLLGYKSDHPEYVASKPER